MKYKMLLVGVAACLLASQASAVLVNVGPGGFTPQASVIDFSTPGVGTVDPVYNVSTASLGTVTVSFGDRFVGQSLSGSGVVTLTGSPTGPLTLVQEGLSFITTDGAPGATSPILSGSPTYNGPISVYFSTPVAAVGLKGGYFDAPAGTTIQAFDATGNSLGSITNSVTGFEFYGLADSTGNNVISGISFYITGNEPFGFEIDDVTFGSKAEIHNTVPEPATLVVWSLLGSIAAGFGLMRKLRG